MKPHPIALLILAAMLAAVCASLALVPLPPAGYVVAGLCVGAGVVGVLSLSNDTTTPAPGDGAGEDQSK